MFSGLHHSETLTEQKGATGDHIMNLAGLLGLLSAIAVAYFSISTSTKRPELFFDIHAIVIVLGGTITVALITFNFKRLFNSLKVVLRKLIGGQRNDYLGTIKEIVVLANTYREDPKRALSQVSGKTHPFLADGMKLLVEYGFKAEDLEQILASALRGKKRRDHEEVKVWHTVSRFPPAFGLLGATLGMIALLETLGEPGSQDRIGPAMAVALVATFYGLIFANLIFIPIAEKLSEVASEELVMRSIIKEGIILIGEKRHPAFIEEYLKSFLAPSLRGAVEKK